MGRSSVALAIVAVAAAILTTAAAAGAQGEVKCGGCSPCGGADCPVLYPSPPPPALPPPPPYYYYSPPPPATYPGSYCPPPPGAYIQIGSTPPGKGPLYPQDPGFMPSAAPSRAVPLAVVGALAALAGVWAAFS
ncbi:leucine-rich repeat extensin-like protein 3 [Setaria italica]|uniref:leucine-rich repeat extensin-like protein 3 n=1 Tax=Setaria italica TaxID=4555 RepID=UPI000350B9EF|nr:leucine-rich repeat extensin-like protein 3 [Setaria italica]